MISKTMPAPTTTALREATRYEDELSPRQREVLALVAAGLTNHEIGERLGISLDGAKWHVSEILSKLGLSSREEAAAYWRYRNSLPMRMRRTWAGIIGMGALKWTGVGAAAGLVAGVATLAAVFALGRGEEESQPGVVTDPTPGTPAAALPCPVDADACDFARELDGWLARGDSPAVVGASHAVTYTCPDPDAQGSGQLVPLCEGAAEGETRDGYQVAVAASDQVDVFAQDGWEEALDAFLAGVPPATIATIDAPRVSGIVCPAPANDCSGEFAVVTNLAPFGTGPTGQPFLQGTLLFVTRGPDGPGLTGILYNGAAFESAEPDGDGGTLPVLLFPAAGAPVAGTYHALPED